MRAAIVRSVSVVGRQRATIHVSRSILNRRAIDDSPTSGCLTMAPCLEPPRTPRPLKLQLLLPPLWGRLQLHSGTKSSRPPTSPTATRFDLNSLRSMDAYNITWRTWRFFSHCQKHLLQTIALALFFAKKCSSSEPNLLYSSEIAEAAQGIVAKLPPSHLPRNREGAHHDPSSAQSRLRSYPGSQRTP